MFLFGIWGRTSPLICVVKWPTVVADWAFFSLELTFFAFTQKPVAVRHHGTRERMICRPVSSSEVAGHLINIPVKWAVDEDRLRGPTATNACPLAEPTINPHGLAVGGWQLALAPCSAELESMRKALRCASPTIIIEQHRAGSGMSRKKKTLRHFSAKDQT